jgi:hypothetical protein
VSASRLAASGCRRKSSKRSALPPARARCLTCCGTVAVGTDSERRVARLVRGVLCRRYQTLRQGRRIHPTVSVGGAPSPINSTSAWPTCM